MTNQPQGDRIAAELLEALPAPPAAAVAASRTRVERWYRDTAPLIHWCRLRTPIGPLHLAASGKGLLRVSFTDDSAAFLEELDRRAQLVEDHESMRPYRQQLTDYFRGERKRFSIPVDLAAATAFQQRVLSTIAKIPAGSVRSYGQIAAAIGKPKAARAVGQALGSNPVPIVLPCHRVVASDGSLGGYTGGLDRKRRLLALEGAA